MLRIGELSRRSGVSPELLRAWERRYGLLHPTRSAGGLRLYSDEDVARVRRMQEHLDAGLAAAEAATLAAAPTADGPALDIEAARIELADALDAFDEPRAHVVLDRLLAVATLETVLVEVILRYLHELGERWARGEVTVAQEHFASAVLRGRLLGLARRWGLGAGPVALLACLPGEQHEFGLLAFGLLLRERGWRITYLGADTPLATVDRTAESLEPALVVLGAIGDDPLRAAASEVRALAKKQRVAIGGDAASALATGAEVLGPDLVAAADRVTNGARLGALPS
jgi:MerR family transcriptional regulator, light-induced transcriptional regulator